MRLIGAPSREGDTSENESHGETEFSAVVFPGRNMLLASVVIVVGRSFFRGLLLFLLLVGSKSRWGLSLAESARSTAFAARGNRSARGGRL